MQTAAIMTLLQDTAAAVIDPRFGSLQSEEIHEKAPGDLVTDADHEAERLITRALLDAYPDAVVLGEEAVAHDPGLLDRYAVAAHAFTVDPVDGTRNFVHGSPDHAVMAAELRDGEVVRSWIWQPQHRRAYVAERGAGAFCNGRAVAVSQASAEPGSWRLASARRRWVGRRLVDTQPMELSWACCGVDYPSLVEGMVDALLYYSAQPWDHAPGSLLLTEAGGAIGLHTGAAYDPTLTHRGGLVAAADPALLEQVVARFDSLEEDRS